MGKAPSRDLADKPPLISRRNIPMDKQPIKGSAQQAKGKIKELAGKAVGDKKLQAKGKAEKAGGKIRNAVGGMKDAMRGR
jgi:uncharacterized protein YjbJ (UPF0337 family)